MPHTNTHHHRHSKRPGMAKTLLLLFVIVAVMGLVTGLILFLNIIPPAN